MILTSLKASLFLPTSFQLFKQYAIAAILPCLILIISMVGIFLGKEKILKLLSTGDKYQIRNRSLFWICLLAIYVVLISAVPNPDLSLMHMLSGAAFIILTWSVVREDVTPILVFWFPIVFLMSLVIFNLIPPQGWWGKVTHLYGFRTSEPIMGEGGRLIPNLKIYLKGIDNPEPRLFVTNSKGFRNSGEISIKEQGELRILNLGDSYSIGYHLDQMEFLGPLLEQELKKNNEYQNINVLNAEISDPAYGLYYLQHFGFSFKPDYVILGLCGNDFVQAYAFAGPGQRFQIDEKGMLTRNAAYDDSSFINPVKKYQSYIYRAKRESSAINTKSNNIRTFLSLFSNPIKGFYDLSGIRRIMRLLNVRNNPGVRHYEILSKVEREKHLKYFIDGYPNIGFFLKEELVPVREMYNTTFNLLSVFKKNCERLNVPFVIVYYPSPFEVIKEEWNRMCCRWGLNPADFDLTIHRKRISEFCKDAGILFIDPTVRFSEYKNAEELFLPGDAHLTERAHKIIAEELAETILKSAIFSKSSSYLY